MRSGLVDIGLLRMQSGGVGEDILEANIPVMEVVATSMVGTSGQQL